MNLLVKSTSVCALYVQILQDYYEKYIIISSFAVSNVKIDSNDSINQGVLRSSGSAKQVKDNPDFEAFQRKVAEKSMFRRVIGVATGVVGAGGVTSGVAAMVGALAGLVGAIPFVLIGIGATAIIGGIVFFVKNSKENIYIKELNKLLQSDGVEDKIKNKKQAISYLNEMISKHKEGSVEYNAAVRFLNENTEIFKLCLGSKDQELVDGITKFLTEMSKNKCEETKHAVKSIIADCLNSPDNNIKNDNATRILTEMLKNEDIKSIAEGIIKGHIKSDNTRSMDNAIKLLTALSKDKSVQTTVVQIVKNCLGQGDQELRGSAIRLLTNALKSKNTDIETFVKEFFLEEDINLDDENANEVFTGKIEVWLGSNDFQLIANTIALLTEMLKNNDTQTYAETIIKNYSGKIGGWLGSGNVQLKANTIALLSDMLRGKNTGLANIAKKIITDDADFVINNDGFADTIKSCLGSGNDGLKAKVVELLNNMLVDSDEELKNKSREILKSDVLNTKGMLNIFLKNEGSVNKDAISLLKPMCKDKEIKNILSNLIGKDLVEKLEKQENKVKSDDIVNVLYENVIVKGIFSEGNKNYIIDLLENEDGLHSVDINFNENGQITKVKREELKSFFKKGELNFEELKKQATLDFGRSLKSITVNGKVAKVDRSNAADNGKILENAFKNAEIDEETKKLIYKFPGQSTISTSFFLSLLGSGHLGGDYMLMLPFRPGDPRSDSYNITVNSNGSVEVQARYISPVIISKGGNNLPMAIEEVHTFKINKGEDTYKTTDAEITVYKLESTSIKLTEENLKKQKVLSQVSYNRDKDNNENNKKA